MPGAPNDGIRHPGGPDVGLYIVHADEIGALGDPDRGRRDGGLEPLVRGQVQDAPQGGLATRSEHDGPPEDAQCAQLAQQDEVVLGGLAEPEPRIHDQGARIHAEAAVEWILG